MSKYESPDYDVVMKEDSCEIRKYTDFYIVEYDNASDPDMNSGFRTLFKYISSENKANEKISMTVPVIQKETSKNRKMAFVVPEKYRGQVPEPNDPNLKVQHFEDGLFGAIRYSGKTSRSKEKEMKEKLDDWLKEKGYKKQSHYMVAVYNGPFTLPMMRRNEVWARIKKA